MATQPNDSPKTATVLLVAILLPLLALPTIIALQTIYHAGDDGAVPRRAPAVVASPPEGYAWLDRKSGIVRIPVERAMVLVVDEARGGVTPE
jgi:hypothetical protein